MPSQKPPRKSVPATSPYGAKKAVAASPYGGEKPKASPFANADAPKREVSKTPGARPEGAASGAVNRTFRRAGSGPAGQARARAFQVGEKRPEQMLEKVKLPVPCAMISRRASDALRRDHLWVYASDMLQVEVGPGEAPGLIPVVDNRGIPMGTALYSPTSQISLRVVSRELVDEAQWLTLLAERMKIAIGRRMHLLTDATNACRIVFSEADDLPGVIVDKYAGLVVLQLLAKGLDNSQTRAVCIRVLREELESSVKR